MTDPGAEERRDLGSAAVLGAVLAYLPFVFFGYGTDIDAANVLRSGGTLIGEGTYDISRRPGSFVHELGTGLLDRIGGSVAINLASVAFAALALWATLSLARADRDRWPRWTVLLLAANPWFWLAATSLGDFIWALGLGAAGALAAQRDRRVVAGVLFGLAVGCRLSAVLMVLSWLVAERLGARAQRPPWKATLVTTAVMGAVTVAVFVPAWIDAGHSLDFLGHQPPYPGIRINLGRWLVKNAAVVGIPVGIVLLIGLRSASSVLGRWRDSQVVRFAALVVLTGEVIFLRYPWKPLHLLPVIFGAALLLGASPKVKQGWLVALVVAQLIGGLVGTTLAEPDVPHNATSGKLDLQLTDGVVLHDARCRLDDRRAGPWPDPSDPDQYPAASARAAELFDCQSETWKVVP